MAFGTAKSVEVSSFQGALIRGVSTLHYKVYSTRAMASVPFAIN